MTGAARQRAVTLLAVTTAIGAPAMPKEARTADRRPGYLEGHRIAIPFARRI